MTRLNKITHRKDILPPLCKETIGKHLNRLTIDEPVLIDVFSQISSTNDYLSQLYFGNRQENDAYHICVAEEQTAGRGRFGHQWWSPAGVNLYLSVYCPHVTWRDDYEALSLWGLIAIAELLGQQGVSNIQLKWPNDICSDNRKLGGMLIERKSEQLIIGIGLNVAMSSVETNSELPASNNWVDLLSLHPSWNMSRNELAANVFKVLRDILLKLENSTIQGLEHSWAKYDALLGKEIKFTYQDKRCSGTMSGVDEKGMIKIKTNEKILHLHSAHVCDIKL